MRVLSHERAVMHLDSALRNRQPQAHTACRRVPRVIDAKERLR
jgi:hypothetical protein